MENEPQQLTARQRSRSSHQQFGRTDDRFDDLEDESPNNASDPEKDKDLERGEVTRPTKKPEEPLQDPNLIVWDGPNDPENPMNWPARKKWIVTIVLGFMTIVSITLAFEPQPHLRPPVHFEYVS